jgi:hypothetical protein
MSSLPLIGGLEPETPSYHGRLDVIQRELRVLAPCRQQGRRRPWA